MAFLVESPWPILFAGVVVEAGLVVAFMQTGRGKLVVWMIVAAVLTLLGLGVERMVTTDREAITNTLKEAADAVEDDDIDRLLACLSPSAETPRRYAHMILDRFDVERAIIRNLKIEINHHTSPPSADAHFQAIGAGRDKKGEFPYNTYGQDVVVHLRFENGRWLASGFSVEDVTP